MTELPQADRPAEVVLPPPATDAQEALTRALAAADDEERRAGLRGVVRSWPTYLDAWARLAEVARDDVERYAYARVAYHRGLDALRQNGWRGSGLVRWEHETNRGFLRALDVLRAAAAEIGEDDEAERCAGFLVELDPSWSGATG